MKELTKYKREKECLESWYAGLQNVKKKNGARNFNDVVKEVCIITDRTKATMMNQWYNSYKVNAYFGKDKRKRKLYIYELANESGSMLTQRIEWLKLQLERGEIPSYEKKVKKLYENKERKNPMWNSILTQARKEVKQMKKEKNESQSKIAKKCGEITQFLLSKNEQYGDSALTPIRIFSKSDEKEQLRVRIDDKLNRLLQGNANIENDEDVIKDLIGYLILLLISMES